MNPGEYSFLGVDRGADRDADQPADQPAGRAESRTGDVADRDPNETAGDAVPRAALSSGSR